MTLDPISYKRTQDLEKNKVDKKSEIGFEFKTLSNGVQNEISNTHVIKNVSDDFDLSVVPNWAMNSELDETVRFYVLTFNNYADNFSRGRGSFMTINGTVIPYNNTTADIDEEVQSFGGINDNTLRIRIKKERLLEVSPAGFEEFIKNNDVRLNYQLENPPSFPIDDFSFNTKQILNLTKQVRELENAVTSLGGGS